MESSEADLVISANDGWLYGGMHNTDIGLAALVNCPVCPATDATEPKMQPGRIGPHFRSYLSGFF